MNKRSYPCKVLLCCQAPLTIQADFINAFFKPGFHSPLTVVLYQNRNAV